MNEFWCTKFGINKITEEKNTVRAAENVEKSLHSIVSGRP